MKRPLIIAEPKIQSPFGYKSDKSFIELLDIAEEVGDIISVHTDHAWGGSLGSLGLVRKHTKKPILAKAPYLFDWQVQQCIDLGADYVLSIAYENMKNSHQIMWEPLSLYGLSSVLKTLILPPKKIVWNSRKLNDGTRKKETIEDVRKIWKGWLCQASNIRTWDDVHPDVDAILVGEHLPQFAKELRYP